MDEENPPPPPQLERKWLSLSLSFLRSGMLLLSLPTMTMKYRADVPCPIRLPLVVQLWVIIISLFLSLSLSRMIVGNNNKESCFLWLTDVCKMSEHIRYLFPLSLSLSLFLSIQDVKMFLVIIQQWKKEGH